MTSDIEVDYAQYHTVFSPLLIRLAAAVDFSVSSIAEFAEISFSAYKLTSLHTITLRFHIHGTTSKLMSLSKRIHIHLRLTFVVVDSNCAMIIVLLISFSHL